METITNTQNAVKSNSTVTPSSAPVVAPSNPVASPVASPKKTKVVFGNFGNGRYSPAMAEVYKDTQRLLSFTEGQAHAVAAQVGRDAGQLGNQNVKLAFGSISGKDKKIGLKEITSSLKVTCTPALSIARICTELDATRKIGLIVPDSGFSIAPLLQDWVDEASEKLEGVSKDEMEKILAQAGASK